MRAMYDVAGSGYRHLEPLPVISAAASERSREISPNGPVSGRDFSTSVEMTDPVLEITMSVHVVFVNNSGYEPFPSMCPDSLVIAKLIVGGAFDREEEQPADRREEQPPRRNPCPFQ